MARMPRIVRAAGLVPLLLAAAAAGGAETFLGLKVEPEADAPYDREGMYGGWTTHEDGRSTRELVLAEEEVLPGVWWDPYTKRGFADAGLLDVDHLVPLREAHESGAHAWTEEKRRRFANWLEDPQHLIAVHRSANRGKGAGDPAEWMPPNPDYWCQYLVDWVRVKARWELSVDPAERDALDAMLADCHDGE